MKKQQQIDCLREENARLKDRLRYQERTAQEGFFGSSTPSAKLPVKPNTVVVLPQDRVGGAKIGHCGHGRKRISPLEADRIQWVKGPPSCPDCGGPLEEKGSKGRSVIEVQPLRRQTVHYHLEQKYCPRCRRGVRARAPGVMKRNLLSNRLLAHVAVQHYVFGVTLGHLENQLAVGAGTLLGALHQLAARLEPACEQLVKDYRSAPVKHADETGWRTDGHNGYAWLFCSQDISLFRFRQSRSGQVARDVLGPRRLLGVLVVDRYHGYNRAPCALQYCYAHLLRDVQDLEKEFPAHAEVQLFVAAMAPWLAQAMKLRGLGLKPKEFRVQARHTKDQIVALADAPAQHPGIQKIQNIFREKSKRLFQWARDAKVPAENNRAERELRPLVIARKISFGSQSEAGARTREVLMSVLHTLRKRTDDVTAAFAQALNRLAEDDALDPYAALFKIDSS